MLGTEDEGLGDVAMAEPPDFTGSGFLSPSYSPKSILSFGYSLVFFWCLVAILRLSAQIEVRSAYYAITPGLPQQPSFITFELAGVHPEHIFVDLNFSFVRNREIDDRPYFFPYNMNVSFSKHGELVDTRLLTNQTAIFPFERIQSQIIPLVSTSSIDFDSVSAVVDLATYEPSAMGIQLSFGFIPASGATQIRLFGALFCIPLAALLFIHYPSIPHRFNFFYGLFSIIALNPLHFFIAPTSFVLFIDKTFAAALRHAFRQFTLSLFRFLMRKDDHTSLKISQQLSWSFFPFLFVDVFACLEGLLEMGTNRGFGRHVPLAGTLSLVGEAWFCCIALFAATRRLSLHVPKHQKTVLTAAVLQTGLHAAANFAMVLNHEFLPWSAELLGTVMYVAHGVILLWTFRPGSGFDPALGAAVR
jgi:hypothetical protein